MPLVEPEHYGWREAVDIVAKKQPGEGAVKSLIDAHARGAAKSSVVDSKGKPREVPAEYWWLLKIAWEKYPPLNNLARQTWRIRIRREVRPQDGYGGVQTNRLTLRRDPLSVRQGRNPS